MKKEAGKKLIEQRVEDFEKNAAVLKKKGHGETNIRSNYIDIFFEALGWNMKSHYDVHREFAQKDNSATKKVDYAFKVNGKVKFFVEAKEASVDLVNNKDAIYQAKRYAYSTNGKAPIVILTDFEEFRVFNVVKAPVYDNTDRELLKKFSFEYKDYPENWDLLWNTFSKEAVTSGSLDALRGKIDKNTKTMDADFLEQITGWRETLAKNIALRNKDLKVDEINEAVQRILDRLIFIRNLEDREIEPENILLDKTKKTDNVYESIVPLFRSLDHVYNGLLFKKHFSEELAVDDKVLKDIIKNMSYPVSPFQFDVIEPEILGRIYEKFLGSKIRLTENHQAKIEEKMEVRKAGGVYYTPEYIVNYIVENTVGKKIEGLTPEEIKVIKICDPACGSGSFLLGAYSSLLDYHEKWYAKASAEDKKKYKADFYKTQNGEIKVTLEKRGDILRNNIFGVDIDKEATEVAIMSLYLKMLDEGYDKGERDLFFVKGHVLPDMTDNVKCGNSLIGTDYFDGKLEIDMEEMKEIKPFDWEKEFHLTPGPSPQGEGRKDWGFDCVIGNPPYVRQETLGVHFKDYTQKNYKAFHGVADLYVYFIEKGFNLVKDGGYLSYIVANKWMRANYGQPLRVWMAEKNIEEIIDFGDLPVFQGATTYPCILRLKKEDGDRDFNVVNVKSLDFQSLSEYVEEHNFKSSYEQLNPSGWSLTDNSSHALLEKLKNTGVPLGEYVNGNIYRGVLTGLNEAFVIDSETRDRLISEDPKSAEIIKPFLAGRDIKRYQKPDAERYLIFTRRGIKIKNYPAIEKHLLQYKKQLMPKPKDCKDDNWPGRKPGSYQWYEIQDSIDYYQEFEKAKIIYPNICKQPEFTFDDNGQYTNQKCFIISLNDSYLLGILNSSISFFLFKSILPKLRGDFYEPSYVYFKDFPIRSINFSNPNDKEKHDTLVSLVDQMLSAQKECRSAKSDSDKKLYEQKISMLDKKIDDLVYKLYGLTAEEIKIVEGN